ncbi:TadE/TadG family type IV pilus assembly protein [Tissierella praeacuta]|uniref:TadE/TadG family type IV pilus assembly protein n=1 Tax=Tissierella praeacuta TaxID=43131 RepID=UPI003DA4906C
MFARFRNSEKGDILILFAGTLILVIIFLGLSTDVILAFNKRDKLVEIGKLMSEARVDLGEELWHSEEPQSTLREITWEIAKRNGLEMNQVDVKWIVKQETNSYRASEISIVLTDVYKCSTLKMIGINELPIKVNIKGGQDKHTGGTPIWLPGR